MPKQQGTSVDELVRVRLRERRHELGWSLDQLAERSGINPSTLSRIESGQRRLTLEHLAAIAGALVVSLDDLVSSTSVDPLLRTSAAKVDGMTVWPLSRPHASPPVFKMRIPRSRRTPTLRSHPGREWLHVLDGTLRLVLGDAVHLLRPGQTAEFATTAPHWHGAHDGDVEVLVIFDDEGQRSHLG